MIGRSPNHSKLSEDFETEVAKLTSLFESMHAKQDEKDEEEFIDPDYGDTLLQTAEQLLRVIRQPVVGFDDYRNLTLKNDKLQKCNKEVGDRVMSLKDLSIKSQLHVLKDILEKICNLLAVFMQYYRQQNKINEGFDTAPKKVRTTQQCLLDQAKSTSTKKRVQRNAVPGSVCDTADNTQIGSQLYSQRSNFGYDLNTPDQYVPVFENPEEQSSESDLQENVSNLEIPAEDRKETNTETPCKDKFSKNAVLKKFEKKSNESDQPPNLGSPVQSKTEGSTTAVSSDSSGKNIDITAGDRKKIANTPWSDNGSQFSQNEVLEKSPKKSNESDQSQNPESSVQSESEGSTKAMSNASDGEINEKKTANTPWNDNGSRFLKNAVLEKLEKKSNESDQSQNSDSSVQSKTEGSIAPTSNDLRGKHTDITAVLEKSTKKSNESDQSQNLESSVQSENEGSITTTSNASSGEFIEKRTANTPWSDNGSQFSENAVLEKLEKKSNESDQSQNSDSPVQSKTEGSTTAMSNDLSGENIDIIGGDRKKIANTPWSDKGSQFSKNAVLEKSKKKSNESDQSQNPESSVQSDSEGSTKAMSNASDGKINEKKTANTPWSDNGLQVFKNAVLEKSEKMFNESDQSQNLDSSVQSKTEGSITSTSDDLRGKHTDITADKSSSCNEPDMAGNTFLGKGSSETGKSEGTTEDLKALDAGKNMIINPVIDECNNEDIPIRFGTLIAKMKKEQPCVVDKLDIMDSALKKEHLIKFLQRVKKISQFQIRKLSIENNSERITDLIPTCCQIIDRCNIRHLSLESNDLGDKEIDLLYGNLIEGHKLDEIDISYNHDINPEGYCQLGKLVAKHEVKKFCAADCNISDDHLKNFIHEMKKGKSMLNEINISYNDGISSNGFFLLGKLVFEKDVKKFYAADCNIRDDQLKHFIDGMKEATKQKEEWEVHKSYTETARQTKAEVIVQLSEQTVRTSKRENHELTDKDIHDLLSKSGQYPQLVELDISYSKNLTSKGFRHLAELVRNKAIRKLKLSGFQLTAEKLEAFYKTLNPGNAVENSKTGETLLEELEVSYNDTMEPQAYHTLGLMVKSWGVKKLSLAGCGLNEEHLINLRKETKSHEMRGFDAADNRSIGKGIIEIAKIVEESNLDELDISQCMLTAYDIDNFRKALGNSKLQYLNLSDDERIPSEGYVVKICELLPSITKKTDLPYGNRIVLEWKSLQPRCRAKLQKALDRTESELQIILNEEEKDVLYCGREKLGDSARSVCE